MASHLKAEATPESQVVRPSCVPAGAARRLIALFLLGYIAGLWSAGAPVLAQGQKPSATLTISPQLPVTPGAEGKLDIDIAPEGVILPRSVIVIRGVPANLQLSGGRPFGPGVWVFPAAAKLSIKLHVSPETRVGGTLAVALTTLEGVSLAEAHTVLVTAPPAPRDTAVVAASPPAGRDDAPTSATRVIEKQSPAPKLPTQAGADLLMLLEKGKEALELGNILHARQFFQRAAERGLAEAAFALAATYDPIELSQMQGVIGVEPNVKLAKQWYAKATQLGSPEAAARLVALARP